MIQWSQEYKPGTGAGVQYHHIIGTTPFGRILLTWKGWKKILQIAMDESPWGAEGYVGSTVEEAKERVEADFQRRVEKCMVDQVKPCESEKQSYTESDGCPTETAVLKRFWREHQTNRKNFPFKAIDCSHAEHTFQCNGCGLDVRNGELKEAVIETCDLGHRFAYYSDHPKKEGRARCPQCMSIGLDVARAELRLLIDKAWNAATDSEQVPHPKWADELIDRWFEEQNITKSYVSGDNKPCNERAALEDVVKAWGSLAVGHYSPRAIQDWLITYMKPAIDKAREVLKR